MRESKLQEKCIEWLTAAYPDVAVANIHGGGWSIKGFPDLLCCVQGRFVCFELKVEGNEPSTAQRIWRKRIERAGGRVYVPYTLDEFKEAVMREYETGQSV